MLHLEVNSGMTVGEVLKEHHLSPRPGDEVNLPKTADKKTCEILDYNPDCEKKHTDAPERGRLCA